MNLLSIISDGILLYASRKDADHKYCAGLYLTDFSFKLFGRKIVKEMSEDPNFCYIAGIGLNDRRFEQCAPQLIAGLEGRLDLQLSAEYNWPACRKDAVRKTIDPEILKFYDNLFCSHKDPYGRSGDDHLKRDFLVFARYLDSDELKKVMTADFNLFGIAFEAFRFYYTYSNKCEDETVPDNLFFNRLKQELGQGTEIRWIESVVSLYACLERYKYCFVN